MLPVRLCVVVLCLLANPLFAQRPKNVLEAVVKFEDVKSQAERNRHGAVRDLGRFGEDQATTILLAELKRAKATGYRSTVVDALGRKRRNGAVSALHAVMMSANNARLMESAANGLRTQGDDGVARLVQELPGSAGNKRLRNAICYSLSRLQHGDAARDAVLTELQRASGQDRNAAMRALEARRDDPKVDAVRVKLVDAKDTYLASLALMQLAMSQNEQAPDLALSLARRLPANANSNRHSAVLAGFLVELEPKQFQPMFFAAARSDKPFGTHLQSQWLQSFASGALVAWLRDKSPKFKEERMQVVAARALRFAPQEQQPLVLTTLRSLLKNRSHAVVQAAAGTLAQLEAKQEASKLLQELLGAAKAGTSAVAITALQELLGTDKKWQTQLLALASHKLPDIRAAALQALTDAVTNDLVADKAPLLAAATANLRHRAWPVRSLAIDLVVALRMRSTPPLLFAMLKKEKARMLEDVRTALRDLTGQQFLTVKEWQNWWAKEGDQFQPRSKTAGKPGRNADNKTVSYWDIPVHSDRVAFVVDTSGSMLKPFGTANATRLSEAKRQLRKVLEALPKKAKMNVITFAGQPVPLFAKLSALGRKQRKQADTFVEELIAKGPTNVHDALAAAFADRDVDTIYVLTDGQPSAGPIVDHEFLAAEVARWNAGRGIRIHTIAIGQKSKLLAQLAKDSGGHHIVSR